MRDTNQARMYGEIVTPFSFSHETKNERFYNFEIKVERLSGAIDVLPAMVSERLVDVSRDLTGHMVQIDGRVQSYNKQLDNGKIKHFLFLFVCDIEFAENDEVFGLNNQVYLDGFICKKPTYRITPSGREIADVLLAVNRPYGKSDYVPCILWGRNAKFASNMEVGERLLLGGRFQSREYVKKLEDGTEETRTAYELSVSQIFRNEDFENETVSK